MTANAGGPWAAVVEQMSGSGDDLRDGTSRVVGSAWRLYLEPASVGSGGVLTSPG